MRLTKEEFIEIWNLTKKAYEKDNEIQSHFEALLPSSYPVFECPYYTPLARILELLTKDEYVTDTIFGSSERAYITDSDGVITEYNISTPENYYDFLIQSKNVQED